MTDKEQDDKRVLVLKKVNVIFAETNQESEYGASLTIDANDPDLRDMIIKYHKENNLSEPKFKEYTNERTNETTLQYNVKLAKFVDIKGKENYGAAELGRGAVVNVVINAYDYDNKFNKGTSKSITAIFIIEPKKNNAMDLIAE